MAEAACSVAAARSALSVASCSPAQLVGLLLRQATLKQCSARLRSRRIGSLSRGARASAFATQPRPPLWAASHLKNKTGDGSLSKPIA